MVVTGSGLLHDLFYHRPIRQFQPAPQRKRHQLVRQVPREGRRLSFEYLPQTRHAVKRLPARQHAGSVNPDTAVMRPPPAHGVICFEAKADRIHQVMAARTIRVGPMLFSPLPQRYVGAQAALHQHRYIGRRGRRGRPQQILQDPLPPHRNRRPGRVRRNRQNRTLPQQASPLIRINIHSPELFAIHSRNTVVPGQWPVQIGEWGVNEIQYTPVFTNDRGNKLQRLGAHVAQKLVVDGSKPRAIRLRSAKIAQLQPLSREIIHQIL